MAVARGEDNEKPDFSQFCVNSRRFWHAAPPYSRTGVSSAIPCSSGPWALDLETLNSRQRLGQTLNTLRFRVRLSEYYNFGRIEPGRHGCFFGLENGHLRPQIIIFLRCAAFVKAAPYRARRKSSLTWGAARQKRRFFTEN